MATQEKVQNRVTKRKKRVRKKRVLLILVPLLIAFLAVGGWATNLYIKAGTTLNDSYKNDGREKSELREEIVDPKFDNVSILIMGVDENDKRDNQGSSRTDTLMLATLNKDDKSVKLLSIPRDSYVYIPEVGYEDKINHAHAFGGEKATVETVEQLLDVPVDYWVKVNFNAFVEVIDALNGINVEVPYEFKESNSQDKRDSIHLLPGMQLLDGEEALALARTRKLDNDIQRGKRQLDIVKSIIDKTTSVSSILKLDDVIEAVGDNMTTNMLFSEMRSFVSYGTSGGGIDVESFSLEGSNYQPAGVYYWQLDEIALNETKGILQDHLDINVNHSTVNGNSDEQSAITNDESLHSN